MRWLNLWVALGWTARWCRAWVQDERGVEIPEYVIVLAVVAALAVGGLVMVKAGIVQNLDGIASCLGAVANGTAASSTTAANGCA